MPTTPQPRQSAADQLDRLTPRWDELTRRARLGTRSPTDYHDLEEEAQAIAKAMVAAFRSPASVNPPARVQPLRHEGHLVIAPALEVIAGITASSHPDSAKLVVSLGFLRQLERQILGGPIAHAVMTPVTHSIAGVPA